MNPKLPSSCARAQMLACLLRRPALAVLAAAAVVGVHAALPVTGAGPASTATISGRSAAATTAPTITSASPSTGATAGGASVTVLGSGFVAVTSVDFGGVPAAGFFVDSASQLRVITPPHGPGSAPIQVAGEGGTGSAGFSFFDAAPVIYTLSPTVAFPDTLVTIRGAGFTGTTSVTDGSGTPVASYTVVSDFEIRATGVVQNSTAPSGAVQVTTPAGASNTLTVGSVPFPGNLTAVTPSLVLDTRAGSGTPEAGQPLKPWSTLDISSRLKAASGSAYATTLVEVTVLNASRPGWLRLAGRADDVPATPTVSFTARTAHSQLVAISPLSFSAPQQVLLNGPATVDVVIQLVASPNPGGGFVPLAPIARLADTRPGSGSTSAGRTLQPGVPLNVHVAGMGGVPASGADQVMLRITTVGARQNGRVTARPSLSSWSLDTVDAVIGSDQVNLAVVPIGADGGVEVVSDTGVTDVVVDAVGWLTPPGTGSSANLRMLGRPRVPLLDTHDDSGAPGEGQRVVGGSVVTVPVAGHGDIPTMGTAEAPRAVLLQVTVSNASAAGALHIYAGAAAPPGADVIWMAGDDHSTLVVTPLNSDGTVSVRSDTGTCDLSIVALGWTS